MATYPGLPDNRLIVDGVDLTSTYRMVLLDGYTRESPEPKTYTVDIPGSDGVLDLTEALTGDVPYENRTDEFNFAVIDIDEDGIEDFKTDIKNFLHGKSYDYQLTFDPGYTYHGRFTIDDFSFGTYNIGMVLTCTITIDAEPYKSRGLQTYRLNATGGKLFRLQSGRKSVHPTLECEQTCWVTWNGKETQLGAGTYRLNEVVFREGWNEIYINSWKFWNITWNDISETGDHALTWNQIKQYRWDDIQRLEGYVYDIPRSWEEIMLYRWSEIGSKKWSDLDMRNENVPETNVYLQYEWKDL